MKNKIFFISFILIWAILIILNIFKTNKTFSEQENRMLAKVPEFSLEDLVSGEYSKKLDNYINDHFIFRDEWLKVNSGMELVLQKKEVNDIYIGKDGYLFEKFDFDEKNINTAIERIENFSKNVEIPVYFILVPNSIYINQDKLPSDVYVENQEQIINSMYENMEYTKTIDVTDCLKKNKDKYIFFKTDHHMTSDGAYLVYEKYCEEIGINPTKKEEFQREIVSTEFLGTFDSKAQILNQKRDEISVYKNDINTNLNSVQYDNTTTESIFNEEYLKGKDKYSYFLNGNNSKVVVKTKVQNGKKLLVVKDSYAHIMAQFLCQNYEEIHFIDPRYYRLSISEYVENNGITECLFLYNVSNLENDIGIRNVK